MCVWQGLKCNLWVTLITSWLFLLILALKSWWQNLIAGFQEEETATCRFSHSQPSSSGVSTMVYYFYVVYLFALLMLLIFIFIPQFLLLEPKYMHFGYHNHKYDFRTSNPQILQTMMKVKTCGITFHVGNTLNMLYIVLTSLFHWSFLQLSGKGILSMRSRLTSENPVHREIKRPASLGCS